MIQVLVDNKNARISYAVSLVIQQVMHSDFCIIESTDEISGCCINYTNSYIEGMFQIKPHSLLTETEIKTYNPEVFLWNGITAFFATSNEEINGLPFDIFAASFWLATRYEEYCEHSPDKYGRYRAVESHAYRNNYLKTPVINVWVNTLKNLLTAKHSELRFMETSYRFVPTVDVDSFFKYRYKGFVRNAGGLFRDILQCNTNAITERIGVFTGHIKDPWDIHSEIVAMHQQRNLYPLFFVLCSEKTSTFDKNVLPNRKVFASRIQELSVHGRIGIHPSFAGHNNELLWKNEKKILENSLGKPVYESRMHYLKNKIPDVYRKLCELGIQFDFTMAYAEHPGFRAGICTPFFFFDLDKNEETNLSVVPLSIMDITIKKYLNLKHQEAIDLIDELIAVVKSVNGVFVSLWHNETFADKNHHTPMTELYEYLLDKAQ